MRKFVVPRHHVMIGCDKLYVHIQQNTETERSNVNHIVDMFNIEMFTIENYSISRDDQTWFSDMGQVVI